MTQTSSITILFIYTVFRGAVISSFSIMAPSLPQTLAALGDAVWSADTLGGAPGATLASGYPALDAVLPGAGWPLDALSELLQPPGLHAEWRLLLPALVRLQQASPGALVLVGPPHVPFGPALQAQGLAVQRLLWLQVSEPQARLWATEQALRCAGVLAVLAWLPQVRAEQLRRLQLAAQTHGKPLFALRPAQAQAESSPAVLRLLLAPWPDSPLVQAQAQTQAQAQGADDLCLHVLKRRGPPLLLPLLLPARQGRLSAWLALGAKAVEGDGHALDRLTAAA
jgi:protein ImuA